MSYSYDRVERQRRTNYGASTRRSTLGYWVPLAVTVTVATIGLAAWVWSERKDHDDDDHDDSYDPKGGRRAPPEYREVGPGGVPYHPQGAGGQTQDESFISRMSGAIRRTPSPQQIYDSASKRVVAGMTAAGAAVGGALSAIREEDRRDFEDHSRWSEEAETRATTVTAPALPDQRALEATMSAGQSSQTGMKTNKKRKTVVVVVSADIGHHDTSEEVTYMQEHASILSHLPAHIDAASRIFVLIYAPDLKQHPLANPQSSSQLAGSMTSSFSNIAPEEAQEAEKPLAAMDPNSEPASQRSRMFDTLYREAQSMVENDTMIMPFTTPTGHVHLLRQLSPEIVYLQETLSGTGGDVIDQIQNWVGQILLVVGDETGHGGLVDSEDERGHPGHEARDRWWQDDPRIGLGKGIEVVEGLRVGEDWRRRVGGHD
ncbi:MAG: hypothetical protein LQ342_005023 [Letrouitia transgressa]|nr:MAG: hypothetical protein LQ342_005023 [Letrouitia transgressa]